MAGFVVFLQFRMVASDQVNEVFLGLDMHDADVIVNFSLADLAFIFHIGFRPSLPDAVASPATVELLAITLSCPETFGKSFLVLDGLNQLLLGIFPRVFYSQESGLLLNF